MKKILIVSFIILLNISAFGQGINFVNSNIRQVFAQAKAQRKMVFIEVYSKTCHHCAEMEPNLKLKEIGDFYNQNFISYKLEVSTEDVRNFLTPKRIFAPSLPMFLYFDANETLLHFAMSLPKSSEVIRHGQTALDPAKRAANFRSRYAAGERSNSFLIDLAMYCRVVCDTPFNIKIMEEYAKKIAPTTYTSKEAWPVYTKLLIDVDNPMSRHLINNYATYKAKFDPKEVKLTAENIVMSSLYSSRGAKYDATKIQQIRKDLVKVGVPADAANARTLLPEGNYYFRNRQTAKATARAEDYFNGTKPQLPDYMYIIKWFNSRATDASYVPTAKKWVAKALALTPANSADAQELKAELAKLNSRK